MTTNSYPDPNAAPILPSSSDLPAPHQLVDAFDHPAWFRPHDDYSDDFLSYVHRGGQLPVDTPDTAWTNSYDVRLNIRYDESTDSLQFKSDQHLDAQDCTPLPQTLPELTNAVRGEMQARHQLYESTRFRTIKDANGNELPEDLIQHLRREYGSLYILHSLSDDELLDIPHIGEKTRTALLTTLEHVFDPPTWCVSCQCPNCDTLYRDAFQTTIFERSLETAYQLTYCPACLNDTIPSEMILGPGDFNSP